MSKWMSGCLIGLALVAVATWWGYRKVARFASGEQSVAVAIRAPADRVFASLANGDSLRTWMAEGNQVSVHRKGMLVPGDTVRIEPRSILGAPRRQFVWTVTEVTPPRILALQLRNDTTGKILAIRRDSLATNGDSTMVSSSVVSPALDMPSKLLSSMFRLESQLELMQLKTRIEGHPMPAARR